MTKKIAVLSDTHGFIHPSINQLVNQCDIAIHAGDVVQQQTLSQLKPKERLVVVAGNNDAHISQLQAVQTVEVYQQQIAVEHGHLHGHHQPSHQSLRASHPSAKIIVYGHSHQQTIDQTTTPWVINPGAAGRTRTNGGASCLVLTAFNDQSWHIEPFRFDDHVF